MEYKKGMHYIFVNIQIYINIYNNMNAILGSGNILNVAIY